MEQTLFLINRLCAAICIPLTFCLCIIAVLRIIGKKHNEKSLVNRANRALRKSHIPMAIILVCAVVVHASLSFTGFTSIASEVIGLIWGISCLCLLVLLVTFYVLRKRLNHNWMIWHRVLASGFFVTFVLHMQEVSQPVGH